MLNFSLFSAFFKQDADFNELCLHYIILMFYFEVNAKNMFL